MVTEEQARKIVNFVAKVYRLDRWDIRTIVVRPTTLDGAKADCQFCAQSRNALVRVRENQDSLIDCVDTIAHELTHCVLWWADYDPSESDEMKLRANVLEQSMRDLTRPFAFWVREHLQEILDSADGIPGWLTNEN